MTKIIRAVIYARYSSDNQREESIDAQVRACTKYINDKGYVLVGVYPDRETTGKNDKRPEFQRMIEDSSRHIFEVAVIHKTNRFARNRFDSAHYKHKLRINGVRVDSATENLDGSPESVLIESLLEGMAEYYSLDLAREVRKGMVENALKGKHIGGNPPYGLKVNRETMKYEINEKEYRAVQIYFESIAASVPLGQIAATLNEAGFRIRANSKRPESKFTKTSFYGWARNRKYKGDYTWDVSVGSINGSRSSKKRPEEEQMIIPGLIPAIISEDLWNQVNGMMENRKRKGAQMKAMVNYLLTGKVVCEKCGTNYAGVSYVNKETRYAYYRCQNPNCENKQVSKDKLESSVMDIVMKKCFTDESMQAIIASVQREYQERKKTAKDDVEPLKKEIQELDRKIDNWADILGEGTSDKNVWIQKINDATEKKQFLTLELNKTKVLETFDALPNDKIAEILTQKKNQLLSADESAKKEILQECVEKALISCDEEQFHVDLKVRFFSGARRGTFVINLTFSGSRK